MRRSSAATRKVRSATPPSSETSTKSPGQPRLVRDRPGRRKDSGRACPKRSRACRMRAEAAASAQVPSTGPRTSACGNAASREGCRARCCRAGMGIRIRSFSPRVSSPFDTRWCTRRVSSRSMLVRTLARRCGSMWEALADTGRATRWSSRRPISSSEARTETRTPTPCGWSSGSGEPRHDRSNGP